MFGSFGPNKGNPPPSYEASFSNKTTAKGSNNGNPQPSYEASVSNTTDKVPNKGPNKGQNNKEEQSNFNPNNEGVFSIPIIKEFSNLNTQNIEIAEQEGMIGCSIC